MPLPGLKGETPAYTVTCETAHGQAVYVAALADNPRIRFTAASRDEAVERLENFLSKLAWYNEFGFA